MRKTTKPVRSLGDYLFARDLYMESFLQARSLYGRGVIASKLTSNSVAGNTPHLKSLHDDPASAKSALHTMWTNPLAEADGLRVNRLKEKIKDLQVEIVAASEGALR
ncbi:hypothetical protein MMC26_000604 [Xylographa opegraphella]|nr:hypothetical protein [Xylographa opegraphella]